MTREEAIICLKGIKNYGRDTFNKQTEWQDCLDMAIEALEQEPSCRNFRQIDLISRWEDMASELDASFGRHEFVCPECSAKANYFVGGSEDWWDMEKPKYCPNCGTRMESDADGSD